MKVLEREVCQGLTVQALNRLRVKVTKKPAVRSLIRTESESGAIHV